MADKSADQDQKKPDSRSPSNNGDDLVVVGIGACIFIAAMIHGVMSVICHKPQKLR